MLNRTNGPTLGNEKNGEIINNRLMIINNEERGINNG